MSNTWSKETQQAVKEALEYYAKRETYWVPDRQAADVKDIKWLPTNADEGYRARVYLELIHQEEEK